MVIVSQHDYRKQPWKNGAGLTREIFRKENGTRVIWRLSLAAVTTDGSFSTFPGSDRILTVVEGNGMRLVRGDTTIEAHPLRPVRFSGDLDLTGVCVEGPVTNFNLIFDRTMVDASVDLVTGPTCARPVLEQGSSALHVLSGYPQTDSGRAPGPGDTAIFDDGCMPGFSGTWLGLVVDIKQRATGC